MTENQANAIYDILVEHCKASPNKYERHDFVYHIRDGCREYRCCHALGFGGKFWDNDGRWYVSGYKEDMTPERREIEKLANKLLAELEALPFIGFTVTGKLRHIGKEKVDIIPFEFTIATTIQSIVERMMTDIGCGCDDYTLEEETIL